MNFDATKALAVLGALLIGGGLWRLDQMVLGEGRTFFAYVIGALAFMSCLILIVVTVTALGWLVDRVLSWWR